MNAYYTNTNSENKLSSRTLPKINVGHGFIEFICSTCKYFMNVRLMSYIEYHFIFRRIKYVM